MALTPAEEYAAIKAIAWGLEQILEDKGSEVRQAMSDTGADRYATRLGKVSLATRSDKIVFDDEYRLLKFAEAADLDGVETIVRPTFLNLFVIANDGAVIFQPTGEQIDFAHAEPGTQYLTTRLTDDAKARAIDLLAATANVLTEGTEP